MSKDERPLIVIASNRGPFAFEELRDGQFKIKRGSGGLVTALSGLAGQQDILWIAAAIGKGDTAWLSHQTEMPRQIEDINLYLFEPDRAAYQMYYNTIANPLLWFIQHQLWATIHDPRINKHIWQAWQDGYIKINRQFAESIVQCVRDSTRPILVFPQDYHLYLVPQFLREALGDQVHVQPFLHIPWPGPDAWRILPQKMRLTLLTSLLRSDRIGFQTKADAFNFIQTCRFYVKGAHAGGSRDCIEYEGRTVQVDAYPISVDPARLEAIADQPETRLHKSYLLNEMGDTKLILRVDRVEPSKNILRGLRAFHWLLQLHPEYRGKVSMLALLVPSRMEVTEYKTYLKEILAEAGLINATYSDGIWEPTRIILGNNYERAIAAMQLYSVLLVNPLADGMNLVAKEGVLVNQQNGVLVLSEFAGVVHELGEFALEVSPFDVHSTAEALHQALTMPEDERKQRAEAMRQQVRHATVQVWFNRQLADALRDRSSHSKKLSTPETP